MQTVTFRSKDDKEHLAEKQLKEFVKIHVEICTKSQDAGNRIEELFGVIEYFVLLKMEVYTLRQLREL